MISFRAPVDRTRAWCQHAAQLVVRKPWLVILACYIPALLSFVALPFWPLYVDTGVNAVYARKTSISNRINSGTLLHQVLPSTPTNVSGAPLEPAVQALVSDGTSGSSSSSTVFGAQYHDSELHIIVHAPEGDVLQPYAVRSACELTQEIFQEQQRTGTCVTWPLGSALAMALPSLTDHRTDSSVAPTSANAPAPTPSPAPETGGINSTDIGECIPPFSILSIWPTVRAYGYGAVVDMLDALTPASATAALTFAKSMCALPAGKRGTALCAAPGLPCAAGPCSPAPPAAPTCIIAQLEPCALLSDLDPTLAEVQTLIAMPRRPLDADGCDAIDLAALDATVNAFRVLRAWTRRAPSLSAFGLPVDAVVSADFAAPPIFANTSSVSRLVFAVPDTHTSATTDLAAYAAAAADRRTTPSLRFIWRQWAYFDVYSSHALIRDVAFSAGSLAFLILYTLTQLGSLVLTLAVVGSILCTLPLALAVYAVVLGVRWIGVLHFLGIFVILGIGADDVFVVLEHWVHSAEHARPSLSGQPPTTVDRMAWTIEHSVVSVSATSATTVAAFAASMASSITPVRLFGLFMVILVTVNFFFVLTLLLAFLAVRERSPERAAAAAAAAAAALELVPLTQTGHRVATPPVRQSGVRREPVASALTLSHPSEFPQSPHQGRSARTPHLFLSGNLDPNTSLFAIPMASYQENSSSTIDLSPRTTPRSLGGHLTPPSPLPAPTASSPRPAAGVGALERQRTITDSIVDFVCHAGQKSSMRMGAGSAPTRIHAFLGGRYANMVHDARRWILLFALIGIAFFSWRASLLTLPHSRPTVWRRGSNIREYFDLEMQFSFGRAIQRIPLTLLWGLAPQDHGSLNAVYEHTDAVLAPDTNFTSPAAQAWLDDLCSSLTEWSAQPDSPIVSGSLSCPMPLIKELAQLRGLPFPMPAEAFEEQLRTYADITAGQPGHSRVRFATDAIADSSNGFLASAHTFKVHPDIDPASFGYTALSTRDVRPTEWTVGPTAGQHSRSLWRRVDHRSANFTRPVTLEMHFTLKDTWALSFTHTRQVWESWEYWVRQRLDQAPPGLKHGFQTADSWRIMEQQSVMFRSGQMSLALSLALACAVLAAVTGNLVLALLASACMCAVVIVFLGAMQLFGWSLGVVECVGIAIMVGLAVDYIVHMATCVAHCPAHGRDGVTFALRTMAMSVMSGAVTTIGAALFLLPCEMAAFQQFGTMVVVTLSTALVFSLVVFPALCYVVDLKDPHTGSVAALMRGDWRRFLGWRSESGGFTVLPEVSEDADLDGMETGAPAELVREGDESSSGSSGGYDRHKQVSDIEHSRDQSRGQQ
eukprot:jgi/Ulvmu1/9338/UM050_0088.1